MNQNTVVPNFSDVSVNSKKTASKNMKALASSSAELLQALAELFVDSVPTKRSHLKVFLLVSQQLLIEHNEILNYTYFYI